MIRQSSRGGIPVGNPIANVLVVIVGILTIGLSIVLGFFAFLALGAIVLVAASVIGLRVWWLKRKLRRQGAAGPTTAARPSTPDVIEGEYRVISRDRDEP